MLLRHRISFTPKAPPSEMTIHQIQNMSSKRSKLAANSKKSLRREAVAWTIVCFQFLFILVNHKSLNAADSINSSGVRGGGGSTGAVMQITTATDPKALIMNDHSSEHYDRIVKDVERGAAKPSFETAIIHPESAGLVSREWHSNGSPVFNPKMKTGSCWCGADTWYVFLTLLSIYEIKIQKFVR